MKVLIVDDVGVIRHSIGRELKAQGFDSIAVASGTDAIKAIRVDNGINVVVTDLLMPGMNGIELFHQVRQIERMDDSGVVARPHFVLVTSMKDTKSDGTPNKEIQDALSLGFVAVVHKQHVRRDLPQILNSLKENKRTGDPLHFEELMRQIELAGQEIRATFGAPQLRRYCETLEAMLLAAEAT